MAVVVLDEYREAKARILAPEGQRYQREYALFLALTERTRDIFESLTERQRDALAEGLAEAAVATILAIA